MSKANKLLQWDGLLNFRLLPFFVGEGVNNCNEVRSLLREELKIRPEGGEKVKGPVSWEKKAFEREKR